MIAFHGDPEIKAKYLARVRAHREADNLIRGTGWDGHRGCAVGCTLEAYDHYRYPIELGIPVELARLEDQLFENMPIEDAMEWPERFLDAIPAGADLSLVWPRFAVWLLTEECPSESGTRVAELYRRRIAADEPTRDEWQAAAAAERAAARAAAWAAERAAAWAAERAAGAAAEASYRHQADKLLQLLTEARP